MDNSITNQSLHLAKIKKIEGKKNNFLPGTKIQEIEKNFSDWNRSHGGYNSMRFSSLKKIFALNNLLIHCV